VGALQRISIRVRPSSVRTGTQRALRPVVVVVLVAFFMSAPSRWSFVHLLFT
jgi:hypothetical protein